MTDCDKYIEMMSAMIDGELTSEQETELRTHIDECKDCKRVYNAFKGISDALSDELVTPPDKLVKGVMYKISVQKKANRRFAFGRFTAIAACLALVLFGASHFGLFSGTKLNSTESTLAAPKAAEDKTMTADSATRSAGNEAVGGSAGITSNDEAGTTEQPMLKASIPQPKSVDGAVLQFGFSAQSALTANANMTTEEIKEPEFLFEAKEMSVYEGIYYPTEEDADKNKLLFTLTTEEDLNTIYDLVAAMPDASVEYTPEDGEIMKADPLYTLCVPANREKDEEAKDKTICIWFVDGEVWCVISDVDLADQTQNINEGKILYKAEGVKDKFETAIKELKEAKGIT